MFISHKSNVIQQISDVEWQCRRNTKGLTKSEYWEWLDSVTSGDPPVVDLSGETGYTIVECTDEDVFARLAQLDDYQRNSLETGTVYNITWSDSKVSAVIGQDMEGNDITIQTHFSGNDSDKNARLLADKWKNIRLKRSRLLAETDYLAMKDQPDMTNDMQIYRKKLRDLPQDNSDVENITWPTKPS